MLGVIVTLYETICIVYGRQWEDLKICFLTVTLLFGGNYRCTFHNKSREYEDT